MIILVLHKNPIRLLRTSHEGLACEVQVLFFRFLVPDPRDGRYFESSHSNHNKNRFRKLNLLFYESVGQSDRLLIVVVVEIVKINVSKKF